MILMACVDGRNGMAFNCRRQSRDRAVRADLLAEVGEACLWVSGATARQFPAEEQSRLCVDESFLEKAGPGEYCFVEDKDVVPYESRIEEVILCHWNLDYPADMYFKMDLGSWKLAETQEYAGSSHEKITEERYVRR